MTKKRKKHKRFGLADIIGKPAVKAKTPPVVKARKRDRYSSRKTSTVAHTPCSCGGENKNCYKCFGTGFYDKVLAENAVNTLVKSKVAAVALGTFASDFRGGDYSVREAGRFLSLPLYDDYSDESSPS